ncbi:MAG TPA: cation diffusion facilitator family transporter [Quisquiliibacterium sp.]|nr:cation diffusion facilitator family transporter [Quisquiliibacterium sp.]
MTTHGNALKRFAWLSILAAVATIGLKSGAWWLTGSVGFLSDALESLVNLAGALMALAMLSVASRPADESHAFGHGKAEFFSSAFEGALIVLAAAGIAYAAILRLLEPQPLEQLGLGVGVTIAASLINLATGLVLLRAGRRHGSIALEADGHHLLTDVWTSAGVVVGVGIAALTGWLWLDPVVALAVGLNIVWTGWRLALRSAHGLMDAALPLRDREALEAALDRYRAQGLQFHAVRTRQAGARSFVSMHVLVPGAWTVQQGHDWLERIEADVRAAIPRSSVFTHLEPIEDPRSLADEPLDREDPSPAQPDR